MAIVDIVKLACASENSEKDVEKNHVGTGSSCVGALAEAFSKSTVH